MLEELLAEGQPAAQNGATSTEKAQFATTHSNEIDSKQA